jgi:hypothetical protein
MQSAYTVQPYLTEIETRIVYCYQHVLLNQSLLSKLPYFDALKDGVVAFDKLRELIVETQSSIVAEKSNQLLAKLFGNPTQEIAQVAAHEFAILLRDTPAIVLIIGGCLALKSSANLHQPFLQVAGAVVAQKRIAIQARANLLNALDYCSSKWPNVKIGAQKQKLL